MPGSAMITPTFMTNTTATTAKDSTGPHSQCTLHAELTHSHAHVPDLHHFHRH